MAAAAVEAPPAVGGYEANKAWMSAEVRTADGLPRAVSTAAAVAVLPAAAACSPSPPSVALRAVARWPAKLHHPALNLLVV